MPVVSGDRAEQQLSCSICLDIFNNPYELTCQHTYCFQCLEKLSGKRPVKCPECRTVTEWNNIRKDFKMQGWVELFESQQLKEVADQNRLDIVEPQQQNYVLCEICESSTSQVMYRCNDCKQSICNSCYKAHQKYNSNSPPHDIISFKTYASQFTKPLDDTHSLLMKERENVKSRMRSFTDKVHDLQEEQSAALNQMEKLRRELNAKINKHCNSQKLIIEKHFDDVREEYYVAEEGLEKKIEYIEQKIREVEGILKGEIGNGLKLKGKSIEHRINQYVDEVKISMEEYVSDLKLSQPVVTNSNNKRIVVNRGEEWLPIYGPSVQIYEEKPKCQAKRQTRSNDIVPGMSIPISGPIRSPSSASLHSVHNTTSSFQDQKSLSKTSMNQRHTRSSESMQRRNIKPLMSIKCAPFRASP